MALSVTQRTNELGIGMALGASRDSILYMVVRQGLALGLAGTAAACFLPARQVTRIDPLVALRQQ